MMDAANENYRRAALASQNVIQPATSKWGEGTPSPFSRALGTMFRRALLCCSAATFALTATAAGDNAQLAPQKPSAPLEVYPAALTLNSHRDARQLVVTAMIDGEARDVTPLAQIRSSNEKVVHIDHAQASAAGDGQASLTVTWNGRSVQVPATVRNSAAPDPVLFKFETMAILTKQGCATGSCHGSPQGKAGFALSLFGYDPTIDRRSLTRDGFSRRLDLLQPEESLLLRKPLMELAHVGGKRLRHGETPYQTLLTWISEGANVDLPAVECERIVVHPGPERVLTAPYLTQQLSVLAYFSDGSVRDVTPIATYDTSSQDIATVDPKGLVTGRHRGQAAVSVRYLAEVQSVYFTVIENVPNFAWQAPAEKNFIDTLVNAKLRQLQYLPADTCDDATFVRRLYLDLTGLIPGAAEARAFIADASPHKRAKLIDTLLAGDAFARFWALKEADLMRVSKSRLKDGRAEAFSEWLVTAQREDRPYDVFARQLLTASGDTRDVPEANFFVAIPGAQERTEMTAQLFLGSRLECAKCHNHPYEKWTMRDYYSLGAVFARTVVDQGVVRLATTGETEHPTTKLAVRPWGEPAGAIDTAPDRRPQFAAWLTAPENPFFARVEVNRIWAHLLGRGIVDPVDDFRSSNPPANGPLLDALAREFVKGGYRRKAIVRLICNSQTYQRAIETTAFNDSDELLFSHARPRLLTAEQLKDAVGLAARTLSPMEALPEQIAVNRTALDERRAALEKDFPTWLERATADVAARDLWLGSWYAVGPFVGSNRQESREQEFGPEKGPLDFTAVFDDGLRHWRMHPEWNDPSPIYTIDCPKDSAVYLARQIYSREARTLQVTARGSGPLWLNGKPALRQSLMGERKIQLELAPGVNNLVMKFTSRQDEAQFRFRVDGSKLANTATVAGTAPAKSDAPAVEAVAAVVADADAAVVPVAGVPAVVAAAPEAAASTMPILPQLFAALAKPADQRSAAERESIHGFYPEMDETFRGIQQRLSAQQQHLEYATQRPYPESMPFMVAFGQPKRETACSCERATSPTLLQALELLNGAMVHQAASSGGTAYDRLDDAQLLDELYLSALARFPSAPERQSGRTFIATATKRGDAVMDLLWSVLNTREFLFQH